MGACLLLEKLGVTDPGIMTLESPEDQAEATLCRTSSEPTLCFVPFCPAPYFLLVLLGGTYIINHCVRTFLLGGSASGLPGLRQSAAHF